MKLDRFYNQPRQSAFEEAISKVKTFSAASPSLKTLEELLAILNQAENETTNTTSLGFLNTVVEKLGDLSVQYVLGHPLQNTRSISSLINFITPIFLHYKQRGNDESLNVVNRAISRNLHGPPVAKSRRAHLADQDPSEGQNENGQHQGAASFTASLETLEAHELTDQINCTDLMEMATSGEHYYSLMAEQESKLKRIPKFDRAKFPPCPACGGHHFLNYCFKFQETMPYEERLKVVNDHGRCHKCYAPHQTERCPWKSLSCQLCGSQSHTQRLHDHRITLQTAINISVADGHYDTYPQDKPAVLYKAISLRQNTISFDVIEIANPVNPCVSLLINVIRDLGASETLINKKVAELLGLTGPSSVRKTKGFQGIEKTHTIQTSVVQLRSHDGYHQEVLPLTFTDSPVKGLKFVDWRPLIDENHPEFSSIKDLLPEPAPAIEGLDEIAGIIGCDCSHLIVHQDKSRSGPSQLGKGKWMTPTAIRTALGWSISGYTGHKPPEKLDIAEQKILLSHYSVAYNGVAGAETLNETTSHLEEGHAKNQNIESRRGQAEVVTKELTHSDFKPRRGHSVTSLAGETPPLDSNDKAMKGAWITDSKKNVQPLTGNPAKGQKSPSTHNAQEKLFSPGRVHSQSDTVLPTESMYSSLDAVKALPTQIFESPIHTQVKLGVLGTGGEKEMKELGTGGEKKMEELGTGGEKEKEEFTEVKSELYKSTAAEEQKAVSTHPDPRQLEPSTQTSLNKTEKVQV